MSILIRWPEWRYIIGAWGTVKAGLMGANSLAAFRDLTHARGG